MLIIFIQNQVSLAGVMILDSFNFDKKLKLNFIKSDPKKKYDMDKVKIKRNIGVIHSRKAW